MFFNNAGCHDLNELKLVLADAVFDATMEALNALSLLQMILICAMTDNCNTMRGVHGGFCCENEECLSKNYRQRSRDAVHQ